LQLGIGTLDVLHTLEDPMYPDDLRYARE